MFNFCYYFVYIVNIAYDGSNKMSNYLCKTSDISFLTEKKWQSQKNLL